MNLSNLFEYLDDFLGTEIEITGLLTADDETEWYIYDDTSNKRLYIDCSYLEIEPSKVGHKYNLVHWARIRLGRMPKDVAVTIRGIIIKISPSYKTYLINIASFGITLPDMNQVSFLKHHVRLKEFVWGADKTILVSEIFQNINDFQEKKIKIEGFLKAYRSLELGCIIDENMISQDMDRIPKILIGTKNIVGSQGIIEPALGGNPYFYHAQFLGTLTSVDDKDFIAQLIDIEGFSIVFGTHELRIWNLK